MADGAAAIAEEARARAYSTPLAEMQLGVVWREMLKRFPRIEVVGEPRRLRSNFVKGYETLPVRIPA
jgi:cytochrome P450